MSARTIRRLFPSSSSSSSLLRSFSSSFSTSTTTRTPNSPSTLMSLLIDAEMSTVNALLHTQLVLPEHPVMQRAASTLFAPQSSGKQLRPRLVLLLASALHVAPEPRQKLAAVTELMHTASLIHDDVLDDAPERRGVASVHMQCGNKLAILAGDFLLARASNVLASIGSTDVVSMLSQTLEELTLGECLQMMPITTMDAYMQKSFYKTASLLARSAEAAAALSPHVNALPHDARLEARRLAFEYGRNVGLSFQLVDDMLDFTQQAEQLGKPSQGADLKLGLATAPVLLAAQELRDPRLDAAVARRFGAPEDAAYAWDAVMRSSGVEQTRKLAMEHADVAVRVVGQLEQVVNSHHHHPQGIGSSSSSSSSSSSGSGSSGNSSSSSSSSSGRREEKVVRRKEIEALQWAATQLVARIK